MVVHLTTYLLLNFGKIKKSSRSVVANWVSIAWREVSEKLVTKPFKKYFIFNALDETEDGIVWKEGSIDERVHEDSFLTEDFFK